jgi:hypothetical protein
MESLEEALQKQPHPFGDECRRCGLEGWSEGQVAIDTATGESITVAEGYGSFADYILVARGHLADKLGCINKGHFRHPDTARVVYLADTVQYRVGA